MRKITHPDLERSNEAGDELTFLTKMSKPLGELLNELKISPTNLKDVKVQEGNLEDVFLQLTKEEV